MSLKKLAVIVLLVCAMVGAGALEASAEKTFKIGAFFPMTGTQANIGRVMSRGAMMGAEHVNAAGGVEGYKFEVIIEDFKNVDVNLAISGVRKLISIDKVPGVLAAYSAPTLGVQPICAKSKVVMINGGAYSPKLVDKPYLHTIRVAQHQMVPPMLQYFWDKGVRRIGVVYLSDPSGELPAKQYVQPIWTKMGGTIVAMEAHQPGVTDFSAYLARIKAGNPDAIICYSTGQDMAYVVKGAREMGMDCPVVVSDWLNDYQTIAGKYSENVYSCVDFFDSKNEDPGTQKFVTDFEAKYKEPAEFLSANYYDAVHNIFPELVRRVVAKKGDPLKGEELENAIWDDPTFKTVYGGKMKLNKDGTVEKPLVIFKVIDGKLTVVDKVGGAK